jgi:dihydrofolate reductase
MRILASVDKNWGIGKDGSLLVSIPEDMKLFREETMGNVVIMGRKTLESLPNNSALDGRINIVLTKNNSFKARNVEICHSVEEVLEKVKEYPDREIYVAGGESIYRQFLPYCDEADLTMIDYEYDADTHFPNLDSDKEWKAVARSEEKTYFNMIYEFVKYKRVSGKK